MSWIDYTIIAIFFAIAIGSGFFFSRSSAKSSKSYFLGHENKWWMLAASGASSNFSVNGTVWNLCILLVLGMKSFWVTLVWWMPNAIFLMVYSGIWIRRCGGVTSVELNKIRFGTGTGAKCARTSFAFMITLFSIASLCMSYIIVHKFALKFGLDNTHSHLLALAITLGTSIYAIFGGFKGVIFSEFLQTVVLFAVAFAVGYVCFKHYSGAELHQKLAHGTAGTAVTSDYWKSLMPEATPRIGMFDGLKSYQKWKDFIGCTLAFSIVGMIGCVGGAGGRYGEQRFLATSSSKEAAKLAALWQFLGFPRWIMTAGLCFLAYVLYTANIAKDPESVMPLFLQSGLLGPGLLGLVVAGLSASFMTSFCSEINACASIVVRDIYQPLIRPKVPDSSKELVWASYAATAGLALFAVAIGYGFVEAENAGHGSALNEIWTWMLGGLLTCFVVPLAFRWYWGRMNGWGFSAGCLVSLIPSLAMLASSFVPAGHFLREFQGKEIPGSFYTYATLLTSTVACIVVTLVTPRIEEETSAGFYAKVRPFGLWKREDAAARERGLKLATAIPFLRVVLNVALGLAASFALYMTPVYYLGHWAWEGSLCLGIFIASSVVLYFTWYKTLPED